MMSPTDELPDKVVDIDILRTVRAKGIKCYCSTPRYVLEEDTRTVYCRQCGARMDAFEALRQLARHWDTVRHEVQRLLDQRRALLDWQPHRVAARELADTMIHKGTANLIPVCPHCGNGIEYTDLARGSYIDRTLAAQRRAIQQRQEEGDRP